MTPIIVIALICTLLVVLFFLSDDWRDIVKYFKETTKREYKIFGLALIPVAIYIGYPIYIMVGVFGRGAENALWNPYIFGGMPSYALTTGYVWFNFLYVIVSTTINMLLWNPLGMLLFIGAIYLCVKRYNKLTYSLMIFMEITMLYFGYWEYGR